MKKTHTVAWAEVAELDLVEMIEYISEDSPLNARNILKKNREQVEQLCFAPEKFRIVPELHDQGISTYREVIISPWRVIYKIEKKNVFVLSVIDGRRNIEDVLLRRLTTQKLR